MVVVAIVLIGAVTGYGLWYRQSVEAAKKNFQTQYEAGRSAIQDGDFGRAARELIRARDAVDLLKRSDPESMQIRRLCQESIAGRDLLSVDLYELMTQYASTKERERPRRIIAHRNEWLLLDVVIADPESDRPCRLDMPVTLEQTRFHLEVDSLAIRESARREHALGSARVVFAARIKEIRKPTTDSADYVVVLDGKSAFLWSNFETYAALGYTEERPDEAKATTELLARQHAPKETTP
jgi:hypothetical protein